MCEGEGERQGTSAVIEGMIEDADLDRDQVLIAGATEEDIVRGIEMITDVEILADLPRKEASTILEDIDMTYHQDETYSLDSLHPICLSY
jgi:hypothetical protein